MPFYASYAKWLAGEDIFEPVIFELFSCIGRSLRFKCKWNVKRKKLILLSHTHIFLALQFFNEFKATVAIGGRPRMQIKDHPFFAGGER